MQWLRRIRAVFPTLALLMPCLAYAGDGIAVARDTSGRTVYVNAEKDSPNQPRPRRASVLVYWSNAERRWKDVPPPSPTAMRAARQAANEVANYVRSRPAIAGQVDEIERGRAASATMSGTPALQQTSALQNPNYGHLARGRAVTSAEVENAITQAAGRHNVDPNLVRAVIKVESNFNPRAVSPKGAMGLMQLMPGTARMLNVSNPFDPQENVDAGVRHLKSLLDNYGGDVPLSLAAYNAGAKAVARSSGVPHIAETQNYVKQITTIYANPQSLSMGIAGGGKAKAPIKVFRDGNGRLTITDTD